MSSSSRRRRDVALAEASDWTCRILAAGLEPATVYWYRFTDDQGHGSRRSHQDSAARNRRAPRELHVRELPERLPGRAECLSPHDLRGHAAPRRAAGSISCCTSAISSTIARWKTGRRACTTAACATSCASSPGEKVRDFHVPVTLDDYRLVSRRWDEDRSGRPRALAIRVRLGQSRVLVARLAGLREDRRGRTPRADAQSRRTRRGSFQPARIRKPDGGEIERFAPPTVVDAPVERFDEPASARSRTISLRSTACTSIGACASAAIPSTSCSPTSIRSRRNAR